MQDEKADSQASGRPRRMWRELEALRGDVHQLRREILELAFLIGRSTDIMFVPARTVEATRDRKESDAMARNNRPPKGLTFAPRHCFECHGLFTPTGGRGRYCKTPPCKSAEPNYTWRNTKGTVPYVDRRPGGE